MRALRILCAVLAICLIAPKANAAIMITETFEGIVGDTSSQALPYYANDVGFQFSEVGGGSASIFGQNFAGVSFDAMGTPSAWLGGDGAATISMRHLVNGTPQLFDLVSLKIGVSSLGAGTGTIVGFVGGAQKGGAFINGLNIDPVLNPYDLGAFATAFMGVDEVQFSSTDDFGLDNITIDVAQVPEPSAAGLLCLGAFGLLRRRSRS